MNKNLEYLTINSNHGYCYDRIQVNCSIERESLENILPLDDIRQNCFNLEIVRASYLAKKANFSSTIKIIAPSRKGIELLAKHAPSESKISHLELTKDTFGDESAVMNLFRSESVILRKKHPSKKKDSYFIYDSIFESKLKKKRADVISDSTFYYGDPAFRYVIYVRYSKINGQPCFRSEWRIQGSSRIKKVSGVNFISDLLRLDLEYFFESMEKKYLERAHDGIDLFKLGKWLRGLERHKKLSDKQEFSVRLSAMHLLNSLQVENYAGFVHALKQLKEEIKTVSGKRGSFRDKILSLTNYGKFKII